MTTRIGADASASYTVTDDDSAIALGFGDVPVLATPRLLAWGEAVTVAALAPGLDDGSTSVGGTVDIRAEVTEVDGRRGTFAVTANDEAGTAAEATVIRVVVNRRRFIGRLGRCAGRRTDQKIQRRNLGSQSRESTVAKRAATPTRSPS